LIRSRSWLEKRRENQSRCETKLCTFQRSISVVAFCQFPGRTRSPACSQVPGTIPFVLWRHLSSGKNLVQPM
jgi:hypothetical protein